MVQFLDNPWGHVVAVSTWLLSLVGVLPALAAMVGIVYYAIQIFESPTVQKRLDKWRVTRKTRKIARLKAEQKLLVAELAALELVQEARDAAADVKPPK